MMRATLAALLLAAGAATRAAEPVRPAPPKCADGRAAVFTGHPFRQLSCPPAGKQPKVESVEPSSATVHDPASFSDLKKLDGEWRGLAYFGGARYEVTLTVSDGGRRALWHAMDYHTHLGQPLEFRLQKPGWFSKGLPRLSVVMTTIPGEELSGRAWIGRGAAAWKYDGRPELHRVAYALAGSKLTATYEDDEPDRAPIVASFELDRLK